VSKKIKRIIITSIAVFLVLNFFYLQHKCRDRIISEVVGEDHKVPEATYTPPIVSLPFVPDKQPVASSRLPIPKKDVAKTMVITTDTEMPRKIEIIVSKSGDIYFPTDTPEGVKAKVTVWKPRFIHVGLSFGASFVTDPHVQYLCLSLDYLYIGRLTLGMDAGMSTKENKALLGLSMRYPLVTVSANGDFSVNITVGYNMIGKSPYGGVSLKW
jgi:hypothetical protein